MSNKATQEQKDAVRRILNKNKNQTCIETAHYSIDEKCHAIFNWKKNSGVIFDSSFVESIYDYFLKYGTCSERQVASIDNIIKRFAIEIDRWC